MDEKERLVAEARCGSSGSDKHPPLVSGDEVVGGKKTAVTPRRLRRARESPDALMR